MIRQNGARIGKPHFLGDRGVIVWFRPQSDDNRHYALLAAIAAAKARWDVHALAELRVTMGDSLENGLRFVGYTRPGRELH